MRAKSRNHGGAVSTNRDLQAVADLASLDAVRAISDRKNQANGLSTDQHVLKLARESAASSPGTTWTGSVTSSWWPG